jgi:hypothetical protein
VWGRLDQETQAEIRNWLAEEKKRQQLSARGLLRINDPVSSETLAEFDF